MSGMPVPPYTAATPIESVEHIQLLIRGVALHAVEGNPQDLEALRTRMTQISSSLHNHSSSDDLLVAVGQCLRTLEEYNQRAVKQLHGHSEELKAMLSAMSSTVAFLTSSSEVSVKQLALVEARLQKATTLDDARQARLFMVDCLNLVRKESARLQLEARTKAESLKAEVELLTQRLQSAGKEDGADRVTGLPGRPAAEAALQSMIQNGKESVAGLYVLDKMAAINGRFGRLIGDEILLMGARNLAAKLSGATLYRWTGPAFLALFDPLIPQNQAELKASQAANLRMEKNLEAPDRSGLVVITCSSHLLRISQKLNFAAIVSAIDSFVSANAIGASTAA